MIDLLVKDARILCRDVREVMTPRSWLIVLAAVIVQILAEIWRSIR